MKKKFVLVFFWQKEVDKGALEMLVKMKIGVITMG